MRWLVAFALLASLACSRIAEPPGGPPDVAAPIIVGTIPESTIVAPAFKGDAEFLFNETVSEGSSPNFGLGTGDLERLIVLSPTKDVPVVSWKRSRITVHPKEGWKPNQVYRIELLTGIMDLRTNRSKTGRVITFTTGAPIPTRFISGRVVDWGTSRPSPRALVDALLLPDSLSYRTTADSTGRFSFGPLPNGEFVVAGAVDQNRNNRLDAREVFDTIRLAAGRDTVGEIWMFKHDTVPARIQAIANNDSMSIMVTFSQQLNPSQPFTPSQARVRLLPDSTEIEVEAVVTEKLYDSLYRRPAKPDSSKPPDSTAIRARADSIAKADSVARADSVRRAVGAARRPGRNQLPPRPVDEGPLTTKPPLFDRLMVRVRQALTSGSKYIVEMRDVESVSRVAGRAIQGFQVPVEEPAVTDSTATDSTRAKPPDPKTPPAIRRR